MLLLPPITLTLNSKLKHFYELNVKDWNYLEIDCNKKTDIRFRLENILKYFKEKRYESRLHITFFFKFVSQP